MTFSSIPFIVYFLPAVLVLYYALSFSTVAQNIVLFFASLVFYAWGAPGSWLLLVLVILLNSLLSYAIGRASGDSRRRIYILSVLLNLALLVFYRVTGFALEALQPFLHHGLTFSKTPPPGLTIFVMHAIGYLTDVHTKEIEPQTPFDVGITIAMFPFVVNGPVQRACDVADQLHDRRFSPRLVSLGVCRFVVGLAKLNLLVACFEGIADNVFSLATINATEYSVPAALSWLGLVCYIMQMYFELSGISDLAIGLGMLFGFRLHENFEEPFTSLSLGEFFRRWNIGVMRWFRFYLERPLLGEKDDRLDRGNPHILSFILMGLWYGTGVTYLLWGALMGAVVLLENIIGYPERLPKLLRRVYTLALVVLGMVILRSQDIYQVSRYYLDLFALNHNGVLSGLALLIVRENWYYLIVGFAFLLPIAKYANRRLFENPGAPWSRICSLLYPAAMALLFAVCMLYIVVGKYYPTL